METGPRTCVLSTTGCCVVPVRIEAGVLEFLVDSGSAATVLSAAALRRQRETRELYWGKVSLIFVQLADIIWTFRARRLYYYYYY